jgi:hypothetical protein
MCLDVLAYHLLSLLKLWCDCELQEYQTKFQSEKELQQQSLRSVMHNKETAYFRQ